MENKQDFVIVNGVLKEYNGPGGYVTIPAGVKRIRDSAFQYCASLTSVTIPKGVTEIGYGAFRYCASLTSVTIPEGVTEIGKDAFHGCANLTSVTIPKGVTKIGGQAFLGCKSLTSVTIPKGVTEIGYGTFRDCASLTSVTIPEGVTEIRGTAFLGCASLTSVTIPEGVTEIGDQAFFGCKSLTSVTIPESVTEIWDGAFYGCESLTSVTILAGWETVSEHLFEDSRPALVAPHISIAKFDREDKPGACAGFAKAYLDGREIDEEIKAGYLKYIKGQKKRLFPAAIQHEELLRLMFAEKMIVRKDIDPLLEECDQQNNIAAKAAVLDYAGRNLKPVDPTKEFKLKEL